MSYTNSSDMDEEAVAMLRLSVCPGVGPAAVHRLLERFGDARTVLEQEAGGLSAVEGISQTVAGRISRGAGDAEEELDLLERCDAGLLAISSGRYPEPLKHLGEAAPPLLRIRGQYRARDILAVAIVGTRNCTHYGRTQARRFAMGLAEKGFTVVSGLARGIDEESHRAALQAGGRTLAVLGCGIARLDTLGDPELALKIAENGALLSELPMNAPPLARHFPPRNRLISGLCAGVVVVEGGARSGSLITARFAGEQGRAVFAIPGSVQSAASSGCHRLIRDGAVLTESPRQVIEELGPLHSPVRIPADEEAGSAKEGDMIEDPRQLTLNERERQVLKSVEHEPRQLDELIEEAGLPPGAVSSTLMSLEIRGLVTRLEGDRYVRGSV